MTLRGVQTLDSRAHGSTRWWCGEVRRADDFVSIEPPSEIRVLERREISSRTPDSVLLQGHLVHVCHTPSPGEGIPLYGGSSAWSLVPFGIK
jgi:hypothetical protein